jgi:hypothetical protein
LVVVVVVVVGGVCGGDDNDLNRLLMSASRHKHLPAVASPKPASQRAPANNDDHPPVPTPKKGHASEE